MADFVSESIVVEADPDTIMDVIADFEAYPEWQDDVKEAEVLETDEDGWGTRARFMLTTKVTNLRYVLDYTYTTDAMRWTLVEGEGLSRNDGEYLLTDLGDGSTEVRYQLTIESPLRIPAIVRRRIEKHVVHTALTGLKHRVEQGS